MKSLDNRSGCGLAVQSEGVLAFLCQIGIVPVQGPITGFDGLLGFFLALAHVDTMVDAGCVGDYEGGALISLSLGDSLHKLVLIGAHADLCYVHIAVAHGHHAQILLTGTLAGSRELGDGAGRSSLGGLAAGVGVYLGIQNQYVDVLDPCAST